MKPARNRLKKLGRIFRIGTRKSALALAQTSQVVACLKKKFPLLRIKIVKVSTLGDEFQSVELFKHAQEGVFTKAIEKKLLSGEIDMAVHSLKDLPTDVSRGLRLAAVLKRADTRDALISRSRHSLKTLPQGAVVGTGSLRRKEQLKRIRPDLRVLDLRGNLNTRVGKVLKKRGYDAILVAHAGILRLKRYLKFARSISCALILPAVGQAAIAIQTRSSDKETNRAARAVNHLTTETQVRAERAFLRALHGGCRVPVGVYTKILGKKLFIKGSVFSVTNSRSLTAQASGSAGLPERIGRDLAKRLIQKGAMKLLSEARA